MTDIHLLRAAIHRGRDFYRAANDKYQSEWRAGEPLRKEYRNALAALEQTTKVDDLHRFRLAKTALEAHEVREKEKLEYRDLCYRTLATLEKELRETDND